MTQETVLHSLWLYREERKDGRARRKKKKNERENCTLCVASDTFGTRAARGRENEAHTRARGPRDLSHLPRFVLRNADREKREARFERAGQGGWRWEETCRDAVTERKEGLGGGCAHPAPGLLRSLPWRWKERAPRFFPPARRPIAAAAVGGTRFSVRSVPASATRAALVVPVARAHSVSLSPDTLSLSLSGRFPVRPGFFPS